MLTFWCNVEKLEKLFPPSTPSPHPHPHLRTYLALMRRKLGLLAGAHDDEEDDALVAELLSVMEETGADFTNTFRRVGGTGYSASPQPTNKGR